MAEPVSIKEKSLEDLEREITCAICHEHYTEPKVLPCLHYYCKKCILRLAHRTLSGKPFHCPECRCEATLPEGGVDNLKTAFFANRLKSKVTTLQRAQGKVEVKCELCTTAPSTAEAFCRQCASFICEKCVVMHREIKTFLTHEVASLEDLKHGRAKPIAVKEPPSELCQVHKQPFILFCFDCVHLICQHCTLKDHKDHNYEFTNIAAVHAKTKLLESLQPLKDQYLKITKVMGKIHTISLEVKAQKESAIHSICESFKELHHILEQREKELVEDTVATAQEKLDKLSEQEKSLSLASAELQSVVDYTERCVSLSTDNELISTKSKVQQKIQEHSKSKRNLEPVEEADMAVETTLAKALQQLCLTQANVTPYVDPTKCTVDLTAPAEVGKSYVGTLTTKLSNGKPNNIKKCRVTCNIKSLYNEESTDCEIDKNGPGRFHIKYTPAVRGCHELSVLVYGQHIRGSPFPLYVSIHPTQLGQPVKVWTGIKSPIGITANSRGEILVASYIGTPSIVKYNRKDERVDLVEKSGLVNPCCLACDDEDNVYCVDDASCKILTCDDKGGNVQLHEVQLQKTSSGRGTLRIFDNKIYIAENSLLGIIKVYDKQLTLIQTIKHRNMAVTDVSTDAHRNIYAVDCLNVCIHVFSEDSTHLRSVEIHEIYKPQGMCVERQYMYVTDVRRHCLCVFSTEGTLVASVGLKGQAEGNFNWPCHVYVDTHGIVYVTDHINNRIQSF